MDNKSGPFAETAPWPLINQEILEVKNGQPGPVQRCTDHDCNKTAPCGHKRCGFPGAGE